jgi:hypothetical protein
MASTSSNSGIRPKNQLTPLSMTLPEFDEIRSRAFALYEPRDREDGHDLDDWLFAEQQVTHHPVRMATQEKRS